MDLVDVQRSQEDFSPSPKVQFPYFKQSALNIVQLQSKASECDLMWR